MNKICTNIKQSKKLVELGIDINTVDMHYMYRHWEIDENTVGAQSDANIGFDLDFYYGTDNGKTYHYIPAWSLAALLDVLPNSIYNNTDEYSQLEFSKISVAYRDMDDGIKVGSIKDNLVDACYEMIIKLHKLNLL